MINIIKQFKYDIYILYYLLYLNIFILFFIYTFLSIFISYSALYINLILNLTLYDLLRLLTFIKGNQIKQMILYWGTKAIVMPFNWSADGIMLSAQYTNFNWLENTIEALISIQFPFTI